MSTIFKDSEKKLIDSSLIKSSSKTNKMFEIGKSDDIIGSYNSLKDPHLRQHFRKPKIRRHLLQANIIDEDNKIIEEIQSTRNQQNIERKNRREIYEILNNYVLKESNNNVEDCDDNVHGDGDRNREDLKRILSNESNRLIANLQDCFPRKFIEQQRSKQNFQRQDLLKKLDRMIRTIKERNQFHQQPQRQNEILSTRSSLRNRKPNQPKKSHSHWDLRSIENKTYSSSQTNTLNHHRNSLTNLARPRSSYGRPVLRSQERSTPPTYTQINPSSSCSVGDQSLKKSFSIPNIRVIMNNENVSKQNSFDENYDDLDDDIQSLDGESFESDSDYDGDEIVNRSLINGYDARLDSIQSLHQSHQIFDKNQRKKYFAFDRRFVRSSDRPTNCRLILRYNGLNNEGTNQYTKRSIKIYQQINVGGNPILIYDDFVQNNDVFMIPIRPHQNRSSFSLTILLDGIRDLRLNSCCVRKHKLGTTIAHFTILNVIGGRACLECQLDSARLNAIGNSRSHKFSDDDYHNNRNNRRKPFNGYLRDDESDDDINKIIPSDFDHNELKTIKPNPNNSQLQHRRSSEKNKRKNALKFKLPRSDKALQLNGDDECGGQQQNDNDNGKPKTIESLTKSNRIHSGGEKKSNHRNGQTNSSNTNPNSSYNINKNSNEYEENNIENGELNHSKHNHFNGNNDSIDIKNNNYNEDLEKINNRLETIQSIMKEKIQSGSNQSDETILKKVEDQTIGYNRENYRNKQNNHNDNYEDENIFNETMPILCSR
ncbi:Beta-1-syntrophin [Sarcoptes scabiei]|nr:Beta-1-syntrophin [Sarcoptes scabiei]